MKAERQRIEAFKLQCWRRFLRVPWTAGRSNLSVLKEINPEYSLEGLMLKLEYFGHLMRGDNSLKKILMLGKIEGRRRRGRQRMRWLDSITDSMDVNLSEKVGIWLWSWSGSATHHNAHYSLGCTKFHFFLHIMLVLLPTLPGLNSCLWSHGWENQLVLLWCPCFPNESSCFW